MGSHKTVKSVRFVECEFINLYTSGVSVLVFQILLSIPLLQSTLIYAPVLFRMDLDADSYDDDEAMMGGFDEDGSFLGAYGRGAMDAPTDLNTSV